MGGPSKEPVTIEVVDASKEEVKEAADDGFITMPVKKLVMSLSMPIMLSTILLALYETVDSIMIGNALGNAGLAGSGVFYPITVCLCYAGALMLSTGLEVQLSDALGANDVRKCRRVISSFLLLSVVFALLLPVIFLPWLPTLLSALGATKDVIPMTVPYAQVILSTQIGYSLTQGCSMVYAAIGKSKFALIGNVVSAATNIGLDYALMFKTNMGLAGASVATAAAQILSSIIMIAILISMEQKKVKRAQKMLRQKRTDRIGKIDIEDESETSETEGEGYVELEYSEKRAGATDEETTSPEYHNKNEILMIPSKNSVANSMANDINIRVISTTNSVSDIRSSDIGPTQLGSLETKLTRHRDSQKPSATTQAIPGSYVVSATINPGLMLDTSSTGGKTNATGTENSANEITLGSVAVVQEENRDRLSASELRRRPSESSVIQEGRRQSLALSVVRDLDVATNSIIPWRSKARRLYEGPPPEETRKEMWRDIGRICGKICSCGIGSALGEISLSLDYILTNVMIGMSVTGYDITIPEELAMRDSIINMLLSGFSMAVRLQYYCLIPNIAQQQSSVVLLSYNKPDRETQPPSEMSHFLSRCISIVKTSPLISFAFVVLFAGAFITLSVTGLMEKLFNIERVEGLDPIPIQMEPDFIISACLAPMIFLPPLQVYGTETLILDEFEDGGQRCKGKKMPGVARSCLLLVAQPLLLVPFLIILPLLFPNPMMVWISWPISDVIAFVLGMCLTAKNLKQMNKKRKEYDMEAIANGEQRTMEVAEEVGDEVTLSYKPPETVPESSSPMEHAPSSSSFSSSSSSSSSSSRGIHNNAPTTIESSTSMGKGDDTQTQ